MLRIEDTAQIIWAVIGWIWTFEFQEEHRGIKFFYRSTIAVNITVWSSQSAKFLPTTRKLVTRWKVRWKRSANFVSWYFNFSPLSATLNFKVWSASSPSARFIILKWMFFRFCFAPTFCHIFIHLIRADCEPTMRIVYRCESTNRAMLAIQRLVHKEADGSKYVFLQNHFKIRQWDLLHFSDADHLHPGETCDCKQVDRVHEASRGVFSFANIYL